MLHGIPPYAKGSPVLELKQSGFVIDRCGSHFIISMLPNFASIKILKKNKTKNTNSRFSNSKMKENRALDEV